MTTLSIGGVRRLWADWIAPAAQPLCSWVRQLTHDETVLLLAVLFAGAVGSVGTHAFFADSRGDLTGWLAAICVELTYLGSAGLAVKRPAHVWLARLLAGIGAAGSMFFNVLVSLREHLPDMF